MTIKVAGSRGLEPKDHYEQAKSPQPGIQPVFETQGRRPPKVQNQGHQWSCTKDNCLPKTFENQKTLQWRAYRPLASRCMGYKWTILNRSEGTEAPQDKKFEEAGSGLMPPPSNTCEQTDRQTTENTNFDTWLNLASCVCRTT